MDQRPLIYTCSINPAWLDYNNHLNVAYYVLIFDHAGEALVRKLGLGQKVTQATGISWVVLENHIAYNREVGPDASVEVRFQLLDHDAKRMHLYFEMHVRGQGGYLASTLEQMLMCMDLKRRRATAFPDTVMSNITALAKAHAILDRPAHLGRRIGIRR
jgi:acyl-CoA thioester hydrolase